MKKLIPLKKSTLVLFVVLFATLFSTSFYLFSVKTNNPPEKVARKFLIHLNKKEYAEAKKLATEETTQMISFMEQFPSDDEPIRSVNIEYMKCSIDENKATCRYILDDKYDTIILLKQNDEWKVHMPKETPDFDDFEYE